MPFPRALACLLASAMCILSGCGGDGPATRYLAIGTGGVTGVYYPVGGVIAKLINESPDAPGLQASVEATGGSVFNINAVLAGDLDFGIAQADRVYQAAEGLAEWEKLGPRTGLRSVCSLYTEMVTLAAASDAGIETLADLEGKTVNIGNPGSGSRGNAIDVLEAAGLDWQEDINPVGVKSSESAQLLQDGRIDAFFFTAGHPAGSFMEATAGRRKVRLIPIETLDNMIEQHPFYVHADIPVRHYPEALNEVEVPTIGVKTAIVTSAELDVELVYLVTKLIFENLETLRQQHAALRGLDPEQMVQGLEAPFHPGAERYLREAGLLPPEA